MATFSNCLQIVNAMPQQDQDALLARLDELQARGMSPKEAQLQAAIDVLAQVEREGGIRKSASRVTDTPAFKRWFGDSKVVDKSGKPLVVYHGTTADFDTFQDPKKMSDLGFHFGTVAQANSFASGKKGSNVMPVYLSIQNPLQMRDVFGPWYGARASMASELVRLGVIGEAESERITNARTQGAGIKLIKDAIERAGYDGVRYFNTREGDRLTELPDDVEVVRNYDGPSRIENADGSATNRGFRFSVVHDRHGVMGGGDTKQEALADAREAVEAGNFANGEEAWIAFRPEQIKSATGNNGEFDPSEPSILKSSDRVANSANFKRWSGGAPVIGLGEKHEFRSGQPVVVEALHGTTNADLTEFKRERANIDSDMGAGFYASNTPEDVATNYANVDGPDLTQRVELLAERLAQDYEFEDDIDAAREEARKRLSEGAPNTLKLYMRFKNPAVLGGKGETFFDYNEEYNEETDDYGEPTGLLVDFVNAMDDAAAEGDISDSDVDDIKSRLLEAAEGDGLKLSRLMGVFFDGSIDTYHNETGNYAGKELLRLSLAGVGFDGVIDTTVSTKFKNMKGMTKDTVHFIAFEPEQIKSATGNNGEFGENRNILKSVDRPQFYSQLQRAIEGVPERLDNMGAVAWKQWLTANAPKLGVKAEEVEWSGIKDYLDLQGKAKLTKADLAAYLDESGVKVSEVTLGDPDYSDVEAWWEDEGDRQTPKYSQYTLPGGENYRELLITLPEQVEYYKTETYKVFRQDGSLLTYGAFPMLEGMTPEAYTSRGFRFEVEEVRTPTTKTGYESAHWDQPNVLAHIRVNDRTDADGKRVLFVEEVQSDAGQDKRKGKTDWKAPFIDKTEGWLNLALKRIALMAVEGGYDKVAFVNGEQSADRYDLSKSISYLAYKPPGAHTLGLLQAWDGNRMKVLEKKAAPEELEGYIGKEVAQRLLATDTNGSGKHMLEGEDIKVGGEGMKTFYDQIVPQAVSKLLPKLGGEKLSAVQIQGELTDEQKRQINDAYARGTREDVARAKAMQKPAIEQPGFDVTDKMRETVGQGLPLFSRDRTNTPEFKRWFGDSKVVDENGKPLVVYHGTAADFTTFALQDKSDRPGSNFGFYFTPDRALAEKYYGKPMAVYLSINNPKIVSIDEIQAMQGERGGERDRRWAVEAGYDGARTADGKVWIAFEPTQIKSATGNNGQFDPENPDIRKSADRKPWFGDLDKLKVSTNYQLGDLLKSSKKLNWWNRTVGTQYNLAQKNPEFKRVFDAVQTFINDVSAYATQAADLAPNILPKLDGIKDVLKKPLSAEDVKALRDPVFGGTLKYMRDENGEIVETDDVQAAGVVFTDEELRDMFGLNDRQIGLYREFRQATDRSLTDLALSDMIRYIGEDGADIREAVMASSNVDVGAGIIESHLEQLAGENPGREESLSATIEAIRQKAEQANRLMDRGYAPLSRFGQYTVYAVGKNGEQLYFGMFETQRDANKMAREMVDQYPDAEITTGTMSQESYKLFSGVTPETLALFGESLGLEESGIDPKSEVFQQYLKLAKTNRSAMKRLIERKGIDGFSEDAGRVLAGFVYSNARQVSTNLHAGEISRSASEIKDGDVKDHAIRLMEYIQNPTEEAQKLKALLFTTFLGGNISSAIVNFTQTATTTFPYLSQFDGTGSVMKRLGDAVKLAARGVRNDDELKQALKRAEDEGVVSPQEVFHLMAQAQGKAQLQTGDGTRVGDALAKTNNFMTKATLAWGRLFSAAEQANRRIAFIAAYKLARDKGMADPFGFAEKAVLETQFSTNKGIRPAWARGAVGGVLFTFKGFTISYLELLGRMLGNGPEGKKAFGLALGTLFLFAGAGGMPFADDLDDVVDGFAQRVLGKSFDSKQAKKEFFASIFGQTGAEFVMGGLTSLPGAPIDLSGRLGLGNIIPGTGIAPKKASYQRDAMEIFGPAGSLFSNYAMAIGMLAQGEVGSAAAQAAPLGIQNLIKGMDMAQMGFYRDTKGRKVIDTNGWEAAAKAMGFQPASVKRIQDATSTQQGLIAQNKLREAEIADKMARARIERKPELAQEAREELAEWNRKNPESPIRIDQSQINRRVQQAMMDKAQRIAKTAPKEIRQSVTQELERAN